MLIDRRRELRGRLGSLLFLLRAECDESARLYGRHEEPAEGEQRHESERCAESRDDALAQRDAPRAVGHRSGLRLVASRELTVGSIGPRQRHTVDPV